MTIELKTSQQQLYKELSKYVADKNIELQQFWYSDRICVPFQTFIEMLSTIGFQIKKSKMNKLEQEIQIVSLENVIAGVEYWKDNQQNISVYMVKRSPRKQQKTQQNQSFSNSNKSRVESSSNSSLYYTNKKFLNEHIKKQTLDRIKLSNTLKNVKNQSNYQLSLKIGQANDICDKIKNDICYMIKSKQNGDVSIIKIQPGKQSIISYQKFQTQYEELKLNMINKTQQIQGTLEDDLKKVLVEVMCLSTDIKKQIKLLQKKGISH